MHLAEAQEFSALQARDHAQHTLLIAKAHMILKADQVVAAGARVFLPQLNHGVRAAARARIAQPHRLHGAEAEGVASASGDLFYRQAGFEMTGIIWAGAV